MLYIDAEHQQVRSTILTGSKYPKKKENMTTKEQFDNMLEAQVEVEVYNPTKGTKLDRFRKLESHLRKAILNFRQRGFDFDVDDIQNFITDTTKSLQMKIKYLSYESLAFSPDGGAYWTYQAIINNAQLFIHVRAL